MGSILLTGPAVEPLTLAEAKLYLRVEHADEDELIASLIESARCYVEQITRHRVILQTWRFVYDFWPCAGWVGLPFAPLRRVVAARFYDAEHVAHAIDPAAFVADVTAAVLGFVPWTLPAPGRKIAGIEIDAELGYGPEPADVPEPMRQAMRLLVAEAYENRRGTGYASIAFDTLAALLGPYKVVSL